MFMPPMTTLTTVRLDITFKLLSSARNTQVLSAAFYLAQRDHSRTTFSLHYFAPLNGPFNLMSDHSRWKMAFLLCESNE
jgi:hypothetical protein